MSGWPIYNDAFPPPTFTAAATCQVTCAAFGVGRGHDELRRAVRIEVRAEAHGNFAREAARERQARTGASRQGIERAIEAVLVFSADRFDHRRSDGTSRAAQRLVTTAEEPSCAATLLQLAEEQQDAVDRS